MVCEQFAVALLMFYAKLLLSLRIVGVLFCSHSRGFCSVSVCELAHSLTFCPVLYGA